MSAITTTSQAATVLGISETSDMETILLAFKEAYDLESDGNEELIPEIKHSKFLLIAKNLTDQITETKRFEIKSPFENTCPSCHGTGLLFKFVRKIVEVNCHICAGKGKVRIREACSKCKGTGRFIKRWKTGGGINVSCRFCDGGSNPIWVKCSECLGKGKKKKLVLDSKIISSTPCKRCKQKGFLPPPKPIKQKPKDYKLPISNPVIPYNIGMKIKSIKNVDELD